MAQLDPLGAIPSFTPFYDKASTERLLNSYYQAPHLFNDEFLTQIKDHAAHHNIVFEEEKVHQPEQSEFNLLRGIRQMGEGFFSGFTTFNVGEATNNPYERIMRSIGQVGGFVGYVPTAPGKILKSANLVKAAQALRGNSVPLVVARKATEWASPIAKEVMEKAGTARSGATADVVKFLTTDKAKHIAEGAFNLGVANMVGSWQLGVNEMLKQGLHGAVTGGAFRGIAELVNKGGIPKIDPITGKSVLNATQKEDQIIRMAASSLYDGMQSTLRGETTPEQIYSYLLGAYFGAHETTAGQVKVFDHIKKTESRAKTDAKSLKRVGKDGKPYDWDTSVYDPEKIEGWDKLTDSEKESVYTYMLSNHGTYGKQAMMTDRLIQETQLEPGERMTAEQAYKADAALKETNQEVQRAQIQEKAEEIGARINFTDITDELIQKTPKGKVFIKELDEGLSGKPNKELGISDNQVPLHIVGMTDENLSINKAVIAKTFDTLDKAGEKGLTITADKSLGESIKDTAPETYEYLMERILKLESPYERAASLLTKQDLIDIEPPEKVAGEDSDIGMLTEVELDRKTTKFVNTYLKDAFQDISNDNDKAMAMSNTRTELKTVLRKHLKRFDMDKTLSIDSDKFIADVQKEFKVKDFTDEAKQELRQLLMRQNQTMPLNQLSVVFNNMTGKAEAEAPIVIGRETLNDQGDPIMSRFNQVGEDVLQFDSIKEIDYAAHRLGIKDNVRLEMPTVIFKKGKKNVAIDMADINKKKNYFGDAQWDQAKADDNAITIQSEALRIANDQGYYYNGSKGDSGKMIFLKWHPESQSSLKDINRFVGDYIDGVIERGLKDPVTDKVYTKKDLEAHFESMKEDFIQDHAKIYKGTGTLGSKKDVGIYFDRSFISNLLWEKELYGLNEANMGGESFAKWVAKNSSIKDAKGFNKRNQIWMTDGYELDSKFFTKTLAANLRKKPTAKFRKFTDDMKLRYRLLRDSELKGLTNTDIAEKFTEATDGMILIEENVLDALNESFGLPSSGQNKSFIIDNDPTYGAFLGKMMFHKASPEASKHMREAGIEMYVYDSAAKEKGSRDFGELTVNDDLSATYKPGADNADYYEMNLKAIKGSLSEKQTNHMLDPQLLPKQMMANLVAHAKTPIQREVINDFFDNTIGRYHQGDDFWNDNLEKALNKEPKDFNDTEQQTFIDNIDKVGLASILDAIKNPTHTEFVAKLYKKILNKNLETLAYDHASGEISTGDYQIAHAEAGSMSRGIDRMMELSPTLEVFLYRDVRNYLQEAMKSFVVTKVIRPKWDHSMSVRMRGLDPWLAKQKGDPENGIGKVSDLNLDSATNKKYLKDTYDVENADEIFFLDNRYMESRWDMSNYLTGVKEKMTLKDIWLNYGPQSKNYTPAMQQFFKTISLRVPMDSISGAHQLTFGGFTGIDGHGAVFHPRTMKALGGADLDGDKAFVFFGMDEAHRQMYHSNKYEFSPTGDETGVVADNKTAAVPKEGIEVLKETLEGKDDEFSARILKHINDKSKGDLTLQDLLTITTAGDPEARSIGASPIGKYSPNARMNIGSKAVGGRAHLGPAVSSKQILNGMYDALMATDSKSEKMTYFDKAGNEVEITITPRDNLDYARELQRAQIAFGSDPLDELGLVGIDNFFNLSWNSMFKVDFGNASAEQIAAFEPTLARKGIYKVFKDFNSAYFSKNWSEGRRWRATEILEMSKQIKSLGLEQQNTMLPQMVKILEPLDYTDDIASRIDPAKLDASYENYENKIIPELKELNRFVDEFGNPVQGGLLGRGSIDETGKDSKFGGFRSKNSKLINVVLSEKLYDPEERIQLSETKNIDKLNAVLDKIPGDAKGRLRLNINSQEFKERLNPKAYEAEILSRKTVDIEQTSIDIGGEVDLLNQKPRNKDDLDLPRIIEKFEGEYKGKTVKIDAGDFTYNATVDKLKLIPVTDNGRETGEVGFGVTVKTKKGKMVHVLAENLLPTKPRTAKEKQEAQDIINLRRYNELMSNAKGFRKDILDQLYRDGTEFMQFDAMDRASGLRLIYALKQAKDNNVPEQLIHAMGQQVQHLKEMDRLKNQENALKEVRTLEEFEKLNGSEKQEVTEIMTMESNMAGFSSQEKLSERIKSYKFFNAHKAKLNQNEDSKYPGMLNDAESYLFDTMMMSSYYRGSNFHKIDAYNKSSAKVKELLKPYINKIKAANSGTFFRSIGLDSPFIKDKAIQDFLFEYSSQLSGVRAGELLQYDIEEIFKAPKREKEGVDIVPKELWEEDYVGVGQLREKAVAELNRDEVALVDELAGHINHYRSSFREDGVSLNKLTRGLLEKNVDAMTTQDYRTLNNFFRQQRSGNMFVNPGKITKEGIVKLSERHWMLFPKTVDEELMIKEFEIFEQRGMFQNYNGEWKEGRVGRPMQIIEHIQYVNGTMQDLAVKVTEDEGNILNSKLSEITGFETLPDGLGMPFFEVATALRDYRATLGTKYKNMTEQHMAKKAAIENLREAYDKADWKNNKGKKFNVKVGSRRGEDDSQRGGNIERSGIEIVNSMDKVLTERAIEMMQWIKGSHYYYNGKDWALKATGNPLEEFMVKNKRGVIERIGKGPVPRIDMKKFTEHVFEQMKEGKAMNLRLGMDNLNIINRNLKISQLQNEMAKPIYDKEQQNMMAELMEKLELSEVKSTEGYAPEVYHPHFIENKTKSIEFVKAQIDKYNEKLRNEEITTEQFEDLQASLINRYKTLTGDWYVEDIIDRELFDQALDAVATKSKIDPIIEKLTGAAVTGNMMERNANIAGWARDIGAWESYQNNLINAYYRQIGQITSQHMLRKFRDHAELTWKNRDQANAWYDYVQDYISRSLGNPSRIPKSWLEGDKAKLMNVKATPYAWWADNNVVDKLNSIKQKLGIGQDTRLPEELRGLDESDIRHWSNMEAKFQMATLLAHPKSAVANIFGGTLHTVQSVGWRNWRNARNINWLKTNLAGSEAMHWNTMKDVTKWVIGHGVVPDFILHEAGLNPQFRKGKYKVFLNDAVKLFKKDPTVKDETLRSLAKKHQLTDAMFNKAAWFMREPERRLRQDAFVAHYLAARERYGHANMELDHPILLAQAKKGVQATQFLYNAPFRPAFSTTSLGKAMTRFQTWAWNSVRFRKETYRQAAMYDFRQGTPEFERFKRQFITDQFVFGLGNVFAYSLFESAMPQPYSWFQDTADWLFGDEKERDRAFFGQWPTAVAPLQMVTPPGLRLVPATFNAIANNDFSRISDYQMWTMFPFGRLARDVKGIIENPMRTIEKTTGVPYMQLSREATKYRIKDEEETAEE